MVILGISKLGAEPDRKHHAQSAESSKERFSPNPQQLFVNVFWEETSLKGLARSASLTDKPASGNGKSGSYPRMAQRLEFRCCS